MLLELLDDLTARLVGLHGDLRERARLHTERAWVLMCLRDRHERMAPTWLRWDVLMGLDVAAASAIADQLEAR